MSIMDSSRHSMRSTRSDLSSLEDYSLHGLITRAGQDDPEALKQLQKRKKHELRLIKKYDLTKINPRKECWFLMDAKWLNKWSIFVHSSDLVEEPPDLVSSKDLLDEKGEPLKGLKAKIDYRGVSPMCYFIFIEVSAYTMNVNLCNCQRADEKVCNKMNTALWSGSISRYMSLYH